jgi:oxygen-dependent protoporphyrinogen oxidase
MKVIVVGAGTAGLVATHALRNHGLGVVALEKSEAPGGRITSSERPGYILDLGAQFFTRYYETTFDICRQVGLGDDLIDYHLRAAAWRDNRMYALELSRDPRVTWRSREYQPGGMRVRAQLARLILFMFFRRKDLALPGFEDVPDLDDRSLAEFARRFSRPEVLEYFLQPAASSLSCAEPEEMSAANGLSLTWHIMSGVFKRFAALRRGVGSLADALARDCGDSIRTRTPARRIVIERGAVRGVEVDDGFIEADAVVCATTATAALRLMPGLPDSLRLPLEKVRYSACCHVMFGLENKIAPEGTYAVSVPRASGSPVVCVGLDSAKSPMYAPDGCEMVHCFTFGPAAFELNAMRDDEVASRLEKEMHRFFPDFPRNQAFCDVYRWDEALCSYPPGMYTAIGRMERDNYSDVRGLYLSGEYMRMPGTVEGAMRSGVAAAHAIKARHSPSTL